MRSPFVRTVSVGTLFFFASTTLSPLAEANLWQDRRDAQRRNAAPVQVASAALPAQRALFDALPAARPFVPAPPAAAAPVGESARIAAALPQNAVAIREVDRAAEGAPVVVLIQDVHLNSEAQENIASALTRLLENHAVARVGVEGAFTDFDFKPFAGFSDRALIRGVAADFMKEARIAAPSYAGLAAEDARVPIVGVDDRAAYERNVAAYRSAVAEAPALTAAVADLKRGVAAEKARRFSPALARLDGLVEGHEKGTVPLSALLKRFAEDGATVPPAARDFLAASEIEGRLNFNRVEAERRQVMERLAPTLTDAEMKTLIASAIALRSGSISLASFHGSLRDLCRRKGVDLRAAPAFDDYVRYALLADGINGDALERARASMQDAAFARLATDDASRELIRTSERLRLIEKLGTFSLTPAEWTRYQEKSVPIDGLGVPLADFEGFYRFADVRSNTMVDRLLDGSKAMAMVVGGFHTPHVAEALRKRGCAVIVCSPRLTKVDLDGATAYLSIFTREKTPVEKLFAGEKLFISPSIQHFAASPERVREVLAEAGARVAFGESASSLPSNVVAARNGAAADVTVDGIASRFTNTPSSRSGRLVGSRVGRPGGIFERPAAPLTGLRSVVAGFRGRIAGAAQAAVSRLRGAVAGAVASESPYVRDRASKERFIRDLHIRKHLIGADSDEFRATYAAMRRFVDGLLEAQGLSAGDFRFYLVDLVDENAFVIRNHDTIFLNIGLLRSLRNAGFPMEAAAFVLAHEIVHIKQGRDDVDAGKTSDGSWREAIDGIISNYADEYDADLRALELMDRAGLSVRQAPALFRLLLKDGGSHMGFTHPALEERVRRLDAAITDPYYANYLADETPFSADQIAELERRSRHRELQAESVEPLSSFAEIVSMFGRATTADELIAVFLRSYAGSREAKQFDVRPRLVAAFETRLGELLGTTPARRAMARLMALTAYEQLRTTQVPGLEAAPTEEAFDAGRNERTFTNRPAPAAIDRMTSGLSTADALDFLSIEAPGDDELNFGFYTRAANEAQKPHTDYIRALFGSSAARPGTGGTSRLTAQMLGLPVEERVVDVKVGSYEAAVEAVAARVLESRPGVDGLVRLAKLVNERHLELVLRKNFLKTGSATLHALEGRIMSEISARIAEGATITGSAADDIADLLESVPTSILDRNDDPAKWRADPLLEAARRSPELRDVLRRRLLSGAFPRDIRGRMMAFETDSADRVLIEPGAFADEARQAIALFGAQEVSEELFARLASRAGEDERAAVLTSGFPGLLRSGVLDQATEDYGAIRAADKVFWSLLFSSSEPRVLEAVRRRVRAVERDTGLTGLSALPDGLQKIVFFHDAGGILDIGTLLPLLNGADATAFRTLFGFLATLAGRPRQSRPVAGDFGPGNWGGHLVRLGEAALRASLGLPVDLTDRKIPTNRPDGHQPHDAFPGETARTSEVGALRWSSGFTFMSGQFGFGFVGQMVDRSRRSTPYGISRATLTDVSPEEFFAQFDYLSAGRSFEEAVALIARFLPPGAFRNAALYAVFHRLVLEPRGIAVPAADRFSDEAMRAAVGPVLSAPGRAADAAAIRGAISRLLSLLVHDAKLDVYNRNLILGSLLTEADFVPEGHDERALSYPDVTESNPGGVGSQVDLIVASLVRNDIEAALTAAGTFAERLAVVRRNYPRASAVRDRLLDRLSSGAGATAGEIRSVLSMYADPASRDRTALRGLEAAREAAEGKGPFATLDGELAQVLAFFPDSGSIRDEILRQVIDEKARTPDDVRRVEVLLLRHAGNIRETASARTAFGEDLFREMIRGVGASDKRTLLLWLIGLGAKPAVVKAAEAKYGVRLDGLRESYAVRPAGHYQDAGRGAREDFFRSFLYGETGLLVADDERRAFLTEIFDALLPAGQSGDARLRDLFRASFMTAFEKSGPYQREKILLALVEKISASRSGARMSEAVAARLFLESLGLVGIKLGQFIASSGLASPELKRELDGLQDRAKPIYKGIVFRMIEKIREAGGRISEVLEPLGSASVKVVYKVRLTDGSTRVLKVKRPEIDKKIDEDMRFLREVFADLAPKFAAAGHPFPANLPDIIEAGILRELDFEGERRNQIALAASIAGRRPGLLARLVALVTGRGRARPVIADPDRTELLGKDLMLETFVDGIPVKDEAALLAAGHDPAKIRHDLAIDLFRQIFIDGLYHADLHGGNVIVTRGGVSHLIDLGAVGRISAENRALLAGLFTAARKGDVPGAVSLLRRAYPASAAIIDRRADAIASIVSGRSNPAEKVFQVWSTLIQAGAPVSNELLEVNMAIGKAAYLFEGAGRATGAALIASGPARAPPVRVATIALLALIPFLMGAQGGDPTLLVAVVAAAAAFVAITIAVLRQVRANREYTSLRPGGMDLRLPADRFGAEVDLGAVFRKATKKILGKEGLLSATGSYVYIRTDDNKPEFDLIGDLDFALHTPQPTPVPKILEILAEVYRQLDAAGVNVEAPGMGKADETWFVPTWGIRDQKTGTLLRITLLGHEIVELFPEGETEPLGSFQGSDYFFGDLSAIRAERERNGLASFIRSEQNQYRMASARTFTDAEDPENFDVLKPKLLKRLYQLALIRGRAAEYAWLLDEYEALEGQFDKARFAADLVRASPLRDTGEETMAEIAQYAPNLVDFAIGRPYQQAQDSRPLTTALRNFALDALDAVVGAFGFLLQRFRRGEPEIRRFTRAARQARLGPLENARRYVWGQEQGGTEWNDMGNNVLHADAGGPVAFASEGEIVVLEFASDEKGAVVAERHTTGTSIQFEGVNPKTGRTFIGHAHIRSDENHFARVRRALLLVRGLAEARGYTGLNLVINWSPQSATLGAAEERAGNEALVDQILRASSGGFEFRPRVIEFRQRGAIDAAATPSGALRFQYPVSAADRNLIPKEVQTEWTPTRKDRDQPQAPVRSARVFALRAATQAAGLAAVTLFSMMGFGRETDQAVMAAVIVAALWILLAIRNYRSAVDPEIFLAAARAGGSRVVDNARRFRMSPGGVWKDDPGPMNAGSYQGLAVEARENDLVILELPKGQRGAIASENHLTCTSLQVRAVATDGRVLLAHAHILPRDYHLRSIVSALQTIRAEAEARGFTGAELVVNWHPSGALSGRSTPNQTPRLTAGQLRDAAREAGTPRFNFGLLSIEDRKGRVNSVVTTGTTVRSDVRTEDKRTEVTRRETRWGDQRNPTPVERAGKALFWGALASVGFKLNGGLVDLPTTIAISMAVVGFVAFAFRPISRKPDRAMREIPTPDENNISLPFDRLVAEWKSMVVAPSYNEGGKLRESALKMYRAGYLRRVLFVNDGSADGEVLRRLKAEGLPELTPDENRDFINQLHYVSFTVNQQKEGAVRSALLYLLNKGYKLPPVTILQDSDSSLEGENVQDSLDRGAQRLLDGNFAAMGVPIEGDISARSNVLAWSEAMTWRFTGLTRAFFNFLDRHVPVVRRALSRSVPGGAAFFDTNKLLGGLTRLSGSFEGGDIELAGLIVEAEKEAGNETPIADPFTEIRLRTDVMSDPISIMAQKSRWMSAVFDADPVAYAGLIALVTWSLAGFVVALPPMVLLFMATLVFLVAAMGRLAAGIGRVRDAVTIAAGLGLLFAMQGFLPGGATFIAVVSAPALLAAVVGAARLAVGRRDGPQRIGLFDFATLTLLPFWALIQVIGLYGGSIFYSIYAGLSRRFKSPQNYRIQPPVPRATLTLPVTRSLVQRVGLDPDGWIARVVIAPVVEGGLLVHFLPFFPLLHEKGNGGARWIGLAVTYASALAFGLHFDSYLAAWIGGIVGHALFNAAAPAAGDADRVQARRLIAAANDGTILDALTQGTSPSLGLNSRTQSGQPLATFDPLRMAQAIRLELRSAVAQGLSPARAAATADILAPLLAALGTDEGLGRVIDLSAVDAPLAGRDVDVMRWVSPSSPVPDAVAAAAAWSREEHRTGDRLVLLVPAGQKKAVEAAVAAFGGTILVEEAAAFGDAAALLRALNGELNEDLAASRAFRFLLRKDVSVPPAFFDFAAAGVNPALAASLNREVQVFLVISEIMKAVRVEPTMLKQIETLRTIMIQA